MNTTYTRILGMLNDTGTAQPFATREDLARLGAAIVHELAELRPPEYVTMADLMRTFGVGRDKMATALSKCDVPAIRMGERVLYDKSAAILQLKARFSA